MHPEYERLETERDRARELAAVEWLEARRWGGRAACAHCGSGRVEQRRTEWRGALRRSGRFEWRCRACGREFTVRTGTHLEHSSLPLHVWLAHAHAADLFGASREH